MARATGRKSKITQYLVGAIVAVIILMLWLSIPTMNRSSWDSSVSANPFKSKFADLSSLDSDTPSEGGAPGYALNSSMLNNPALAESIASSLFQSGPNSGDPAAAKESLASGANAASAGAGLPVYGGGPAHAFSAGKLKTMPSITGGNPRSMSAGAASNKFFGYGNADVKPELAPLTDQPVKKAQVAEKRNSVLAMLQNSESKSALAAKSSGVEAARNTAASAFEKTSKSAKSAGGALSDAADQSSAGAGISLGEAGIAQDLKVSDPKLSQKKVTLPEPKLSDAEKAKLEDEAFKKMLLELLVKSMLGPMFGALAGSLFSMPPSYAGMGGNTNTYPSGSVPLQPYGPIIK